MEIVPGILPVWWSAALAVFGWVLGAAMMIRARPIEWSAGGPRLGLAHVAWLGGSVMLAVHVWTAFAIVHGWSNAAAFDETERLSGVGEGVYVNYVVLIVWGADAAWLTIAPRRYARRLRWLGRAIHGFLAFVIFNAAVVYVEPFVRWYGAAWFAVIGLSWVTRPRPSSPVNSSRSN